MYLKHEKKNGNKLNVINILDWLDSPEVGETGVMSVKKEFEKIMNNMENKIHESGYRYLILENLTQSQLQELITKNDFFTIYAADPSKEKVCFIYIAEDNRFLANDQNFYWSIKLLCKADKYKEFDAEKGETDDFVDCVKKVSQFEN